MNIQISVPTSIQNVVNDLHSTGVESYFVGGCVRDALLGKESDDIDFCLVGATPAGLESILDRHCDTVVKEAGSSFPVWIGVVGGEKFDFAFARTEKKAGQSRKEFLVNSFGVSIEDDLMRRDLTINAIAVNCVTGEVVDPFGGVSDLQNRIAREVSPAFAEDTLRVLRAARFISRFWLIPSSSLVELCQNLQPTDISSERVGMELKKMINQAEKPSLFFRFLLEVGWLGHHFQPVLDLVGLHQDPEWHPEGDVFEHTMHCMDAAQDPFIRVVMLCHDLGKVSTTEVQPDGRITARGHAKAGVPVTREMLRGIKFISHAYIDRVCFLVENHMIHTNTPLSRKAVGRMLRKLKDAELTYDQLVEVCRCDVSGRPPLQGFTPDIGQEIAREMEEADSIQPIVTGRMLIDAGFTPGPELGQEKQRLLDLQLEGKLTEENWKEFLNK